MPSRSCSSLVVLVACTLVSSLACTATQPVRVLPKGQSRVIASLGGPYLPRSTPTALVPYSTVGLMHGASDNTTLVYNVHVLMAVLGVAGIDVGAAHRLRAQSGFAPELTALGQAYLFTGSGGTRAYPHVNLNASWRRGGAQLLYVGAEAVGQFEGSPAVLATPLAGWQFPAGRRLVLQTELKWMAANRDTRHGIFEGESSIGGHGALGFQLGAQWAR
ncbi:MAG TPA: hypothetical protein VHE78_03795 [Gemmatimonadaceae bacterium]|nr:hypothetical protein [Gemmatimonadaceae bacterium]